MNALIIEDHPLIVLGVKITIQDSDPNAQLFSANTFPGGLAILEKEKIDIVILDIDIPGGENLKMMERIRSIQPQTIILIHSAYDEQLFAMPYLQAGADGFLSKQASPEEFKTAMETVLENKKYVSYEIQQSLIENIGVGQQSESLTTAELQVMHLLLDGKWTKEIAFILDLKPNTISTYKRRIFDKLGVRDSIELSKKMMSLKRD